MNCTKYGGFRGMGPEPHRPGPENPPVSHPRFATVRDCQDRIGELRGLLASPETVGAVKLILEEQVRMMESLIKDAWERMKGRST